MSEWDHDDYYQLNALSGFLEGSIIITYVIPAGRQMSYHDSPGTSHASKHAVAYIPK